VDTLVTIIFEVLHRPRPDYNLAAAMGSVLLILTIVLTLVYRKTVAGKAYITVTGKGYRPGLINLGKWKYAGFALNILYAVMAIFLPIFILLVISTHRVWVGSIKWDKLSLRNFYELIFVDQYAMGGFGNSIFLGIIGATTAMLACVIVSYFIYRSRYQGRATVEYLTNLPVGLPGIVLAMGFLLAFIKTPLYATIWILMIAYVIRFIPYGLRSVSSVLLSLSPELDESSRACGSSWLRTLKNITFPLLKPGFVAGWLLLFIIFFRELPISMLLWSSGNHVMSVVLWQLLEHRTAGLTSAYAIMQIMVIFIVIFVMHKTTGTKDVKV
jgi:iron(III) transport system permease protein